MSKLAETSADTGKPKAKPATDAAPVKAPAVIYVLDTTATATSGPRKHEAIVDGVAKPFTFEYGKPLALPPLVAARFLRHDAFKLTDAEGNLLAHTRRPKQPEE